MIHTSFLKKLSAVVLCLSIVFCLCGCGAKYLRDSDYSTCLSIKSYMKDFISTGSASDISNLETYYKFISGSRTTLYIDAMRSSSGKVDMYTQIAVLDSVMEMVDSFINKAKANNIDSCQEVYEEFSEYIDNAAKTSIK